MDNKISLNQIGINNIYETVIDLEGPKYPLDNMNALNEAADYILNKLKSYGVKTEVQEFYVKGFDEPFRNIIGLIGDQSKPAIVIGSHYDTVRDCPGANDNLSAVAVSLEVARVLNKLDNPPTVIIAAFTLEEKHPGLNKALELELFNNKIHDEKHRFTSANMLFRSEKVTFMVGITTILFGALLTLPGINRIHSISCSAFRCPDLPDLQTNSSMQGKARTRG